jgi:predicted nucleotidyltransferase
VNSSDNAKLPPSVRPLALVASALGQWRGSVVFIGAAVAPLLQTSTPFPRIRPTRDVDAISAAVSYTDASELETAISRLGFRRDPTYHGHAYRWISPEDIAFDLVPGGKFFSATGNKWDQMAVDRSEQTVLPNGIEVRHACAPFLLILKCAAHCDRGQGNPQASADLEDLLGVLASRPTVVDELSTLPSEAREYLRAAAHTILAHPDCDELLEAHLIHAVPRAQVVEGVRRALHAIAR